MSEHDNLDETAQDEAVSSGSDPDAPNEASRQTAGAFEGTIKMDEAEASKKRSEPAVPFRAGQSRPPPQKTAASHMAEAEANFGGTEKVSSKALTAHSVDNVSAPFPIKKSAQLVALETAFREERLRAEASAREDEEREREQAEMAFTEQEKLRALEAEQAAKAAEGRQAFEEEQADALTPSERQADERRRQAEHRAELLAKMYSFKIPR